MMKPLAPTLLVVLVAALVAGCATLARQGLIEPADVAAVCADAALSCSVAAQIKMDDTAKQVCAGILLACAGSVPPAP